MTIYRKNPRTHCMNLYIVSDFLNISITVSTPLMFRDFREVYSIQICVIYFVTDLHGHRTFERKYFFFQVDI
jgi:hypothetical protein